MAWEIVSKNPKVKRLKVPGGWLVSVRNGGTTFISDPNWEWDIGEPVPQPAPVEPPALDPLPEPEPIVEPVPDPLPEPIPEPAPTPDPEPAEPPVLDPEPVPQEPEPTIEPTPEPEPEPTEPVVEPIPEPQPLPEPLPNPAPTPTSSFLQVTRLGTNLTGLSDWQTEMPFKDLMRTCRKPILGSTSAWQIDRVPDTDENGYIKSLLTGEIARYILCADHVAGDHEPGEYIFSWDGTGTIRLNGGLSVVSRQANSWTLNVTQGGIFLEISAMDSANYPRNFKMIRTANSHTFLNDLFVDSVQHVSVLRFMDWLATNDSTRTTTLPSAGQISNDKGCAPELIVETCNALNKHAWVNIPHMATEGYVQEFIQRLSGLNANLKIYIEHSNECWNGIFSQSQYCVQQGLSRNLDTNQWLAGMYYHALRTVDIGESFKKAFGNDRVITVLGAFAANDWFTGKMLQYPGIAEKVDAVAIAPYFGTYTDVQTTEEILSLVPGWIEQARGRVRNNKRHTDLHPHIKLIAYEGGQHILIQNHDSARTAVLIAANNDPRMGTFYTQYLDMWKAETGDGLFAHFVNTGKWTKWGCWGSMKNLKDTMSPKYLALKAFAQAQ